MSEISLEEAKAIVVTKTAPKITEQSIKDKIANITYYTHHSIMTICVIEMVNGFYVVGKSAPASPENFDPHVGQRFAFEDAFRQLWPLEGYALKQKMYLEETKYE